MENEIGRRVTHYLEIFEQVRNKVGDEQIAVALVEQVGKDCRVERMHGPGQSTRGNGDQEATAKQLAFLRRLRVAVPSELTKIQASALIDEAQEKVIAQ